MQYLRQGRRGQTTSASVLTARRGLASVDIDGEAVLVSGVEVTDDHADRLSIADVAEILDLGDRRGFERAIFDHARVVSVHMTGIHPEATKVMVRLGHLDLLNAERAVAEKDS